MQAKRTGLKVEHFGTTYEFASETDAQAFVNCLNAGNVALTCESRIKPVKKYSAPSLDFGM